MDRILNKVCNCKDCIFYDKCKSSKVCENFSPIDEDDYAANVEKYLKEHVEPSNEKRMRLRASGHKYMGIREESSLAEYYCSFVNDAVGELKQGHIAYVFSIEQIADVMRFLSDIHIDFNDGVYYLTL